MIGVPSMSAFQAETAGVRDSKRVCAQQAQFPCWAGRFVDDLAEGGAQREEAEFGVDRAVRARSVLLDWLSSAVLEEPTKEQPFLIEVLTDFIAEESCI